MRIRAVVAFAGISAAVAVGGINADVNASPYIRANYQISPLLTLKNDEVKILNLTNIPSESIALFDNVNFAFNTNLNGTNQINLDDSNFVFNGSYYFNDYVTATSSQFALVFKDQIQIDFDHSTTAVDFDPVSVTGTYFKEIAVADEDNVYATEFISKQFVTSKSDVVTTIDSTPSLHRQTAKSAELAVIDTITAFNIHKSINDSFFVAELSTNKTTMLPKTDFAATTEYVFTKLNLTSDGSILELITASDTIDRLDFNKNITDAVSITKSIAKNFTVAKLADNDTVFASESIAISESEKLFDSLTAVEGIKFNPNMYPVDIATVAENIMLDARLSFADTVTTADSLASGGYFLSDTVTTAEDITLNVHCLLSDTVTTAEDITLNVHCLLSDTVTTVDSVLTQNIIPNYAYPDYVNIQDGQTEFVFMPYSYTIAGTKYFVPNTGVIGAAETFNSVILNDQFVTTPSSFGGLVVNFHYGSVSE